MNVVIVKYNAGNAKSVEFALNRLGIEPVITDRKELIENADKVIFPGVGEASSAMNYLKQKGLDHTIQNLTQPVLGICLGMQLMTKFSEEGQTEALNIFDCNTVKFQDTNFKIPHVGWNKVFGKASGIFSVLENQYVYFVHSYYVPIASQTTLTCDYGKLFTAALNYDNFFGVQFHPEKSGDVGLAFLDKFLKL